MKKLPDEKTLLAMLEQFKNQQQKNSVSSVSLWCLLRLCNRICYQGCIAITLHIVWIGRKISWSLPYPNRSLGHFKK